VADLDVIGIGNALVDVLSHEREDFIARHGLVKGSMQLIDEARARELYAAMGPGVEVSGGSAANTIVGVASFGGRAHYLGKIRDDQLGEVFAHDLRSIGVGYTTPPATSGPATGRCLVVVTPDAQRTLSTYLGAAVSMGPADIDPELIARGRILYLEGYLFDPPAAQEAFRKAADLAHAAGRKVALTLSDPFCVDRHRAAFLDLVEHHVDVLFANEAEILSLYEARDFDTALGRVRGHCELAALTRSEHGSVVVAGDDVHVVPAHPVPAVVDTTGAGDLYAAGFLFGLSRGLPLATCGRLGSLAAAEVISHVGARPVTPLANLAGTLAGGAWRRTPSSRPSTTASSRCCASWTAWSWRSRGASTPRCWRGRPPTRWASEPCSSPRTRRPIRPPSWPRRGGWAS
jgi:sugar/nucleoside kinase (ribokinase family)